MRFNDDILPRYMSHAPLALAFERILECEIYTKLTFERPILDVGCGEGLFAKMLFGEKIDTGLDPNPTELERARELGAYDELLECTGDKIPKPDGHFKTVFSNSVLEHIEDLQPVLREIHRVLAPGGKLYFTVPSDRFEQYTVANQLLTTLRLDGAAQKFRKSFNGFWKHYHAYPPEQWRALAEKAGFRVVDTFTYDPPKVAILNDFLAPFGAPAFVLKRVFNRWVLAPQLRRLAMGLLQPLAASTLRGGDRANEGGLVFVTAEKPR